MNNTIKLLYSLLIGIVALVIAKLVHPSWSLTQLLIFGLIVFAVTFILTLLIKKKRAKKIYLYTHKKTKAFKFYKRLRYKESKNIAAMGKDLK